MAKYDVIFDPPARPLGNADVEFNVQLDGGVLGKLHVSKGSIVWVPRDHELGYRLNWQQFASLMEAAGKASPAPRVRG